MYESFKAGMKITQQLTWFVICLLHVLQIQLQSYNNVRYPELFCNSYIPELFVF